MSRIIKNNSAPPIQSESKVISVRRIQLTSQEHVEQSIESVLEERDEILHNAEIEANKLLEAAKAEVNQLLQNIEMRRSEWELEEKKLIDDAYEKGLNIGIEEGRRNGYAEYENLIEKAKEVVNTSKIAFKEYLESSETVIVDIAIKSAERIIHTSLADQKDNFIPLVKRALKEAKDFKEVQIHVHPLQYELLISEKNELDAVFPNGTQCFIYPDEDLEEYSCYIESEHGRIDASVSSQLVELKKNMMELLKGDE
ncbi:flagellar assembly protein FliH [Lederbergia wuyishanensis]|uniref:Flagellar assembly protein FliH n=1 Tax=Lederbergia wuyishanensis TaxID=1347903 RepID=A0ABU0CZP8_9BACI|nr:flagellar assembly protein FliH [Lederbergia wuyishanensis]MCJ8006263.1 flagellar assembly protein FliH [Lederbergia wuyishanensis]MDQ0341632.1 flagellar assembly protein FliH [Lederbergia wuyishanensis]